MTARIMIVGEAWGRHEAEKGRPFVGPSGGLLNVLLSANNVERRDCYLTNVFNFQPVANKLESLCGPKAQGIPTMPALLKGKFVLNKYKHELDRLYNEINSVNPNVILACGGTACWALLKDSGIKKLRGAPIESPITGHKVLPTWHPAAVLREYKLRPIIFADIKKAIAEAAYPEVVRPKREFWLRPSYLDLLNFEPHILAASRVGVDIETWQEKITCIGFATSTDRAIVIPFIWHGSKDGNYWPTLDEELKAWAIVRKWLALPSIKVGQNFKYDMDYLWSRYGIAIGGEVEDTMLTHHAMQPEMEKGLGFLGSIYTNEPSWKMMRTDIKTLKKED